MKLRFTKMQGAGNDFVMINGIAQKVELSAVQYRFLADRQFGIGADQILVVQAPEQDGVDFRYRIFNADGGEVEQCGNGARCFVKFVRAQGLTRKRLIRVATRCGIIAPELQDDGEVTVDMGAPIFAPERVPFDVSGLASRRENRALLWPLRLDHAAWHGEEDMTRWVCVLSMGNPHAVQVVADVDAAPVTNVGPRIENHPRFAQRVNAGWMQVVDRHAIRLRVWERGAGETLACGTGACAAAVAGIELGLLASPVAVQVRGGRLRIAWAGDAAPVLMTGPAQSVFEGEVEL